MKYATAILAALVIVGLAATANAQTPSLDTSQKVQLTLAAKNAAGQVIPIPSGTIMVWTAVNDQGPTSGTFEGASVVTGNYSVWYLPTAKGTHTLSVTLTPEGHAPITNTVVLTVTLDPAAVPATFTITVGTPVKK